MIKIEYKNEYYGLRKDKWFSLETYMEPSKQIQIALNKLINEQIDGQSAQKLTREELIKSARQAREMENPTLSKTYLEELLRRNPMDGTALAVYSSMLRKSGHPEQAIEITSEYIKKRRDSVVLTTRAAAFCDLEQWEEAKRTAKRAYAIQSSDELLGVFRRIKARKK